MTRFPEASPSSSLPLLSSSAGSIPKNGRVAEPGFSAVAPGKWRNQYPPCFGLPPCVYDRATLLADDAVIPLPSLGVNWLSHGAKKTQTLPAGRIYVGVPLRHQCADRSWGGIKNVD